LFSKEIPNGVFSVGGALELNEIVGMMSDVTCCKINKGYWVFGISIDVSIGIVIVSTMLLIFL